MGIVFFSRTVKFNFKNSLKISISRTDWKYNKNRPEFSNFKNKVEVLFQEQTRIFYLKNGFLFNNQLEF